MSPPVIAACGCVVLVSLTGCGASTGGDAGGGRLTPSAELTLAALSEQGRSLVQEAGGLPVTPAAALPAGGTASYAGVAGLVTGTGLPPGLSDADLATLDTLGSLELTADFGRSTVEGTLSQLQSSDLGALQGQIVLRDGTISGAGVEADLTGRLRPVADAGRTVDVDARLDGAFRGAAAEMMAGEIRGDVTVDGQTRPVAGVWGADSR
jgi:hypothetical protein